MTQPHDTRRVVIIGAGPAGLTAAYELSKRGRESIVVEREKSVGGISRTVNYKNYLFDIGGHRFFTKFKRVEDMWNDVLGQDFLRRKRMSRIYYNKKFFHYPLRPINALNGLGVWNSSMILMSYLYAHFFPNRKEETFEQWVSNRFGRRLYNTFFKSYTEKVWGMPCSEIRAEWAAQRIQGLSLLSALKNALARQNGNGREKTDIKTLINSFDYPKLGPGMMWQSVSDIVHKNGSRVSLETEVTQINWNEKTRRVESVRVRTSGREQLLSGTDFISSMPIQELVRKLRPAVSESILSAADNLRYRDFLTVVLIVNKPDLFPDNWLYIHDPDVKVGRIQNFKNWSPFMVPDSSKTCLGLEYFCFQGDELWNMTDSDLIELGKKELADIGLVRLSHVEDGCVVRVPKAYPSYDSHYQANVTLIRQFLGTIQNLQLIGRNGMHRYNNQDHSMVTAMLAVENIEGAEHDLWKVNDEMEYHEECKAAPDLLAKRAG